MRGLTTLLPRARRVKLLVREPELGAAVRAAGAAADGMVVRSKQLPLCHQHPVWWAAGFQWGRAGAIHVWASNCSRRACGPLQRHVSENGVEMPRPRPSFRLLPPFALAVWIKLRMLLAPYLKRWTYTRQPEQVCSTSPWSGAPTALPGAHRWKKNAVPQPQCGWGR